MTKAKKVKAINRLERISNLVTTAEIHEPILVLYPDLSSLNPALMRNPNFWGVFGNYQGIYRGSDALFKVGLEVVSVPNSFLLNNGIEFRHLGCTPRMIQDAELIGNTFKITQDSQVYVGKKKISKYMEKKVIPNIDSCSSFYHFERQLRALII
jgi:hypothetical protein